MKILKDSISIMCMFIVVWSFQVTMVEADPSPLYDQVLDALEALPRDGGIAVDFGVEEQRYTEQFKLTEAVLRALGDAQVPQTVLDGLTTLTDTVFSSKDAFMQAVEEVIGPEYAKQYEIPVLNTAYDGRAAFAIGDSFEARFRADTDCYVALIHIGIATKDEVSRKMIGGNIVVLLPNQKMPDPRITAGKVYSTLKDFSIHLTAGAPPGNEVINILCSTKPMSLFAKTATFSGNYAVITPTDEPALQYFLNGLQQVASSGKFGGTSLMLQIGGETRDALPKKFGRLKPMGGTGTTGKFFPPLDKP